jgi:hypothetical protein
MSRFLKRLTRQTQEGEGLVKEARRREHFHVDNHALIPTKKPNIVTYHLRQEDRDTSEKCIPR